MDYGTFKVWVRKAGLDLKGFARLLGMNQRSISNYSSRGEVPQHVALLAVMMVELEKRDVDITDVIAKIDTSDDKARRGRSQGTKSGPKSPTQT